MLTDFAFNGGPTMLSKFSNFMRAVNEGDMTTAQHECHRHYKDQHGHVHELRERNEEFQRLFFSGPPLQCPRHPAADAVPHQHSHPLPQPAHPGPSAPHQRHAATPSSSHSSHGRDDPPPSPHSPPPQSLPHGPAASYVVDPMLPAVSPDVDVLADVDEDVAAACDEDLPDLIAEEFEGLDRRIESASNLSNLSLLDAASQRGSYHLVDEASLRFGDSLSAASGHQHVAATVVPVFDLSAQGEAALRSVGASMVHDAANLFFGTGAARPTLNPVTAHLLSASTSVMAKSLVHNQLNDLLFGGSASHLQAALLDTAASVGLALAYGNAEAARKVAFESALNYAVHELGLPASYGHTKVGVGGTLFQTDHRILSGQIDQHSASYSPLPGISVGLHFRTTHVLRQEGAYLVDRHSNSLGGHLNGLGVGDVSVGFGSRRDTSNVIQRAEGAQTVSTWFTRFQEGKVMADVRLANRVSDLEDLSLRDTLLLFAHNPLMGPLALLSRLPALHSYKQTNTVRSNTDGTPLSITRDLPLSLEAQRYQPTALLAPLSSDGVPALMEQASAMHRVLQQGLAQEARARVGRVETIDSTFHEHGEGSSFFGVGGGSESDRYYNRGRVLETTASDRTVIVDGETVTDLHSRTNVFTYADLTYYYHYTKSVPFGVSRHKHEERYHNGQKRVENKLTQTVDQHTRLLSKADGTAYTTTNTERQLPDGSLLTRREDVFVKEDAAQVTTNHGVSATREESVAHHGEFDQSLTSSVTRAVAGTEHVIATDIRDHSRGRFRDQVSKGGQQLSQAERTEQIDAHVVSQYDTLRNVDPNKSLYAADIGIRQAGNVQGQSTATIFQETTQRDEYKVGHPTLHSEMRKTAVGALTVTAQLLQAPDVLTRRAQRWGNVQSLQSDSSYEHIHSAYSTTLETGTVAHDGTRTSATYAPGTFEESISPLQRQVIAARKYVATSVAGSTPPPPLFVDRINLDPKDELVRAGIKSEHHLITRIDELHTATYDLRPSKGAAADGVGQSTSSDTPASESGTTSSTQTYQPVDSQSLAAALSSTVPAELLRGHAEAKEGDPVVSHVRRATGISVRSQMTHTDYDVKNNVLTEAHSTLRSSIIKESELLSGTGSTAKYGEEKTVHDAPFAVTRLQLKTEKGLLWNKSTTISSKTATINAAGAEQNAIEDPTDGPRYAASAGLCGAVSTAASYGTGLAFRAAAGGKVDSYDAADMGAATTRSLFQSHIMDSVNTAEQTIQRRAALSIEKGALEQARVPLKLKAAAAAGTVIVFSNAVRHIVRKTRVRARAKERKRLAERRRREDAEIQREAEAGQAPAIPQHAADVLPPSPNAPSEQESSSEQWLVPTMKDVGVVAGTSALDFAPVAVQIAMAGTKGAFLAASGAGLAIDTLRTGWGLATSSLTKMQALEQIGTSVVSTTAGVGGALCLELVLGGVLGLAGLPLAVFVGIGTALVTLGVQWVVMTIIDRRRKAALRGEYQQLCAALGVAEMCTDSELTRAWRDASRRVHPDRGGSHEAFVELNNRHKRAIELRILLGHSLEREDGMRRNERTRMPTWIRWWLHVLTNLNASLQEHARPAPPVDELDTMLDLYHPVSDRFTGWQRQQAVYAAELEE